MGKSEVETPRSTPMCTVVLCVEGRGVSQVTWRAEIEAKGKEGRGRGVCDAAARRARNGLVSEASHVLRHIQMA